MRKLKNIDRITDSVDPNQTAVYEHYLSIQNCLQGQH